MLWTAPPITTSASVSPVFSSASLQALGVLAAVLELQRVDRQHFLADLVAALGVEEGVEPRARADAVVVAAVRAHVLVVLEVGLVEHRLAGRALDPQALRAPGGARAGRSGAILAGSSFQASSWMLLRCAARGGAFRAQCYLAAAENRRLTRRKPRNYRPADSSRSRPAAASRRLADARPGTRAPAAPPVPRGGPSSSWMILAADHHRVRRRCPPRCAVLRIADAEAHAHRHVHVLRGCAAACGRPPRCRGGQRRSRP